MPSRAIALPGTIFLLPGKNLDEAWRQKVQDHPHLPASPRAAGADLNAMNAQGGVPARIGSRRSRGTDPSLLVYGRTYVLRLFPTKSRSGYTIASITPLRLADHHRLATASLQVRPAQWEVEFELRQLPPEATAFWPELQEEWSACLQATAAEPVTDALAGRHAAFLATVDRLIDADEKISAEKADPLETSPGSVVLRKQREAVTLLRDARSRNPSLLSVLVDHRTAPVHPAPDEPSEALDADQLKGFRAAVGVPDMLLVLGPPGTGKTRVISQIARSVAQGSADREPGRVLVTSRTHRAVDNVLTRLPSGLLAVRVGSEGKVIADGQPYLIERQATELRQQIVNSAGRSLAAYIDMPFLEPWVGELTDRNDRLGAATRAYEEAQAVFEATWHEVEGAAQGRAEEIVAGQARTEQAIARSDGWVTQLTQHRDRLRARAGWPLLGAAFGALARRAELRLAAEQDNGRELHAARQHARAELARAKRQLDTATRDHHSVVEARATAEKAARHRAECRDAALSAARACRDIVSGIEPFPFRLEQERPEDAERELAGCHAWLTERLPVLHARAHLLTEWHAEVSGETDQLFPELIRYADVVGATCIGAASRPELSNVDFDLAIVGEAGQLGAANALVPLVRARRAVLVGDDQQLPPFLDSDVEAWAEDAGDPLIRDLLTKSVLELLADKLPPASVVRLTWQRRMPEAIADFISASFYGGTLRTAVTRKHRDLLFRSPLAFVDTASLPLSVRSERSGRERERSGQPGYTNPAEAKLLTELAVHYHRQSREWAVIVPYRAQADDITNAITPLIGDAELARLNVGTVDSFQGGERDVILYGFTRSNLGGRVGSLDELRRANVAFTRARYQLVMTGDLDTLTEARDQRFRSLARGLREHVAGSDLRQYQDVRAQLARLDSGKLDSGKLDSGKGAA